MKSIKISNKSYEYLKRRSEEERRPMTTVLDLIVEKEDESEKMPIMSYNKKHK